MNNVADVVVRLSHVHHDAAKEEISAGVRALVVGVCSCGAMHVTTFGKIEEPKETPSHIRSTYYPSVDTFMRILVNEMGMALNGSSKEVRKRLEAALNGVKDEGLT